MNVLLESLADGFVLKMHNKNGDINFPNIYEYNHILK